MDLFATLEHLKMSLIVEKNNLRMANDLIFPRIMKEYEEILASFANEAETMPYQEYNLLIAKELKEHTFAALKDLQPFRNRIEELEKEIALCENKIVYFSSISVWEFLSVLKLFQGNYHIMSIDGKSYFVPEGLTVAKKMAECPKSNLITIYKSENHCLILNPNYCYLISSDMEQFLRFYINIKATDQYILVENAYFLYESKKDCIKR